MKVSWSPQRELQRIGSTDRDRDLWSSEVNHDNNKNHPALVSPSSTRIKAPIDVYGVEGRYATALFSAASKKKQLDQVEQELGKLSVSCGSDT